MTVGSDLHWLADETGDLRPDVARQLQAAPVEPVAQAQPAPERPVDPPRPPVEPVREPRRARAPVRAAPAMSAQAPRPAATQVRPIIVRAPRLPWWTILVIGASAVAGGVVGRWVPVPSRTQPPPELVSSARGADAPGVAVPGATVSGINVNLRSGPGLGFPIIARLLDGDMLLLGEERDGWYSITTAAGVRGYVFGAFVRGAPRGDRGPGRVIRPLVSEGSPQVVLRAGEKVFLTREPGGQLLVTLPTGRTLRASSNDVAPLD